MTPVRHLAGDATEWIAGRIYDLGVELFALAERIHGDWQWESPPASDNGPDGGTNDG